MYMRSTRRSFTFIYIYVYIYIYILLLLAHSETPEQLEALNTLPLTCSGVSLCASNSQICLDKLPATRWCFLIPRIQI